MAIKRNSDVIFLSSDEKYVKILETYLAESAKKGKEFVANLISLPGVSPLIRVPKLDKIKLMNQIVGRAYVAKELPRSIIVDVNYSLYEDVYSFAGNLRILEEKNNLPRTKLVASTPSSHGQDLSRLIDITYKNISVFDKIITVPFDWEDYENVLFSRSEKRVARPKAEKVTLDSTVIAFDKVPENLTLYGVCLGRRPYVTAQRITDEGNNILYEIIGRAKLEKKLPCAIILDADMQNVPGGLTDQYAKKIRSELFKNKLPQVKIIATTAQTMSYSKSRKSYESELKAETYFHSSAEINKDETCGVPLYDGVFTKPIDLIALRKLIEK